MAVLHFDLDHGRVTANQLGGTLENIRQDVMGVQSVVDALVPRGWLAPAANLYYELVMSWMADVDASLVDLEQLLRRLTAEIEEWAAMGAAFGHQHGSETATSGDAQMFQRSAGWHPAESVPYAHVTMVHNQRLEGGLGLLHKELGEGGNLDVLSANGELGMLGSRGEGNRRVGVRADAQVFNVKTGDGGPVGIEFGALGLDGEVSAGEDGMTVGGQAYAAQGAIRIGGVSEQSETDEQVRAGVGAGPGGAVRLHWGDQDRDGVREPGVGGDLGPVSADIKTEDPLRTALKVSNPALRPILDVEEMNLTEKVVDLLP